MTALRKYLNSLQPLGQETWDKVSALFSEGNLKKGELFIREGQIAEQIAFLNTGIVRAFYRTEEGAEYNKHFFTSPCFIGSYSSLITGQPNQMAQQALTGCDILVADYKNLSSLYDHYPDLERLARRLAELSFVNKEQKEIEIVLLDADQRYSIFQRQFPELEQLIPQYHIASYLGVSATQLSRIRKKMARR
jgi:CRP-like cAMP-binding protein